MDLGVGAKVRSMSYAQVTRDLASDWGSSPPSPTSKAPTSPVKPHVPETTSDTAAAATTTPAQQVTVVHQQNLRARELDPFAAITILAVRAFVPDAKLGFLSQRIALQRQTVLGRAVRTVLYYVAEGFSQEDCRRLPAPISAAVNNFLYTKTAGVFQLAVAGLTSLKGQYGQSIVGMALDSLIAVINDGLKTHQGRETLSDTGVWTLSEIDTVSTMLTTINGLPGDARVPWVATVEHLIESKFA